MKTRRLFQLVFPILALSAVSGNPADWPQFRGPGGNAISETAVPPVAFGPSTNVFWKTPLPSGYSSPVVTGDLVFVTSDEAGLETLALSRKDGRILWRKAALAGKTDSSKKTNDSPGRASSTPATDGTFVFVFFGKAGLIAYDLQGTERWRWSPPAPDPEISASPILIDDKVIIVCDIGPGSFVEAFDKKTGHSVWRTARERVFHSVSTPFHWVNEKRDELIVAGSYRLVSYDPRTGKQNWQYSGTAKSAISTPVAARDLLVSASVPYGGASDQDASLPNPLFEQDPVLKPDVPSAEKAVLAIRACASGEVDETHLAWKNLRSLPGASSPVIYKDRLFTVKSGGFVSAYDLQTGKPVYQDERLDAPGDYYASPVAAAGRVYFVSRNGVVTVIDAAKDTLTVLAQNKINEATLATPALIGASILIRTEKSLYSFGVASPR